MATKAAMANRDDQPRKRQEVNALQEFGGGVLGKWNEFTRFLSDVRAEMRKVVAPSRKEVQVTTSVVIVAVFLFGIFFFVVDGVFKIAVHMLLGRMGGLQ
jgi:preprotein translocase subunit SecE